jgi:hypothetical protein
MVERTISNKNSTELRKMKTSSSHLKERFLQSAPERGTRTTAHTVERTWSRQRGTSG